MEFDLTEKKEIIVLNVQCTVWKNEKFGLTEKIFRQIDSLVISLVKALLSRNFCDKIVAMKFRNFRNTLWKNKKKLNNSHRKNISSKQRSSNFFSSKYVGFTKFLQNRVRVNFLTLHTVV